MEPQAFWILRFDALPPSLRDSGEQYPLQSEYVMCSIYS